MKTSDWIKEPARDTSILTKAEVVVVGSGPAGICAASIYSKHDVLYSYGTSGWGCCCSISVRKKEFIADQCQFNAKRVEKTAGTNFLKLES